MSNSGVVMDGKCDWKSCPTREEETWTIPSGHDLHETCLKGWLLE